MQCETGQCVTDSSTCPDTTTGCPFDKPVHCPYQGCFEAATDCEDEATAETNLQGACFYLYPGTAEVPCALEANCKATASECATSITDPCYNFLFPNTIKSSTQGMSSDTCYVPACPADYPVKCDSGLCVVEAKNCPAVSSQMADVARCSASSGDL